MAEGFLIRKGGGGFNFPNSVIREGFVQYNAATVNAGNLITNEIHRAVFNTINVSTTIQNRRKLIKINDTKFVYLYTDSNFYLSARIITVNSNKTLSFGTALIVTGSPVNRSIYYYDAVLMPDGRIFIIGSDWSNSGFVMWSILTPNITTNTLVLTVSPVLDTSLRFSQNNSETSLGITLTNENQVLVSFTENNTGQPSAILINVLTSSITIGPRFAINTTFGSDFNTISKIGNENKFLVTFRNTSTSQPFMLILVVTGGNTITMGTSYVVHAISCASVRHVVLDPVNIFIGYFNQSSSPIQHWLTYATIDGAAITNRSQSSLSHSFNASTPPTAQYGLVLAPMSGDRISVIYNQRDSSAGRGLGHSIISFTQNGSWSSSAFRNINTNSSSHEYRDLTYIPINGNNGIVVHSTSSSTGGQDFYTFVYDIGRNTLTNTTAHTSIRGVAKDTAISDQPLQFYTTGITI
jgi:hypothetical protein